MNPPRLPATTVVGFPFLGRQSPVLDFNISSVYAAIYTTTKLPERSTVQVLSALQYAATRSSVLSKVIAERFSETGRLASALASNDPAVRQSALRLLVSLSSYEGSVWSSVIGRPS